MALKLNVQEQNAAARLEIVTAASLGPHLTWLGDVLTSRGIDPKGGILAEYGELPNQGGRWCTGTWLTTSREFWRFAVLVPPQQIGGLIEIETFENVTSSISTSSQERGTGKSFGALAIEVLGEVLDS